ncbi:MAG: Uma2 family endonuclease [Actinomycetota bacterium]
MPEQRLLTYEDLESFPDDGLRRELLGGELIVSPSPKPRHQRVLGRLYLLVGNHIAQNGGGEVFFAPLDVIFSKHDVVEPDLLFIAEDQSEILTQKNVQGVPAVVVEVVSDSRIDRVRKRDVYASFGVPEYVIVDPDSDRVESYTLKDGAYGKPEIFELGDPFSLKAIPGLTIDVRALLA